MGKAWGASAEWRAAAQSGRAAAQRGLLILALVALGRPCLGNGDLPRKRADADVPFRVALEALATQGDELGLTAAAATTRAWFVPRDPRRQYLFLPPADDSTRPAADALLPVRQWHGRFVEIRRAQAERLFTLARQCAESGAESAAYRLLHEVLREDPDHAEARRVLGYSRDERGWRYPQRRPARRRNRLAHPLFGWSGDQYVVVESEHFVVTTNLHVRAAREAARYLEQVHIAWQQLFYEYWSVPGRLAARFGGDDDVSLGPARVFDVVLFKDRDEYVRQLRRAEPQIEQSVGYYSRQHRIAFFYAGDDAARATWVHEATHQFFQESGEAIPLVGEQSNFWVVEGVALYMESLAQHEGYFTTGGVDANRLQYARYRLLSEGFYVPLESLVAYGRLAWQRDPKLPELYSQSAGLVHGFLDGGSESDRAALMRYLRMVYRGAAQVPTMSSEFDRTFAELDQQYRESLAVTDEDLVFVDRRVQNLCLAHTQVTDTGLSQLRGLDQLQWLDLSFTAAGDAGLAAFAAAQKLNQLSLEQTRITPDALKVVGNFRHLEELDLSQTAVDDASLPQLAGLTRLKVLWLTGTRMTDAGLPALAALRNLEQLDVTGTGVTAEGFAGLRKRLPKLK